MTAVLLARRIIGRNYLDPEDVEQGFGVRYTESQLTFLSSVPFRPEVLDCDKDTHVLFPGYYPFTLSDVRCPGPCTRRRASCMSG